MSRRFGRNQKRKMREQIAFAVEALEEARDGRKRMKELYDEAQQEISDAKQIAGQMSVLFDPTSISMRGSARDHFEVMGQTSLPSLDSINSMATATTFKSMRLPMILSRMSQDVLGEMIHVRVHYDDKTLGYALTQEVMRVVPHDILFRRIGAEIGHQLIQEITKGSK